MEEALEGGGGSRHTGNFTLADAPGCTLLGTIFLQGSGWGFLEINKVVGTRHGKLIYFLHNPDNSQQVLSKKYV